MKILAILFVSCLTGSPVFANACHDLWFSRNQIMDRAGYCFGSNLGKAIFDNSDCTGKSVSLDRESQRIVNEIVALEKRIGCKVNTRQRRLDLVDLSIRRRLIDIPVLDELPGMCREWLGRTTRLHAARSSSSRVIAEIRRGDDVSFEHLFVGGWSYVTVWDRRNTLNGGGWMRIADGTPRCRERIP